MKLDEALLNQVKGEYTTRGTSFHARMRELGINVYSARNAILGASTTVEALLNRKRILEDVGLNGTRRRKRRDNG